MTKKHQPGRCVTAVVLLVVGMLAVCAPAHAQTVQFAYDALGRLVSVQYPDRLVRYAYDPAGNRLVLSIELVNPVPTVAATAPRSAVVNAAAPLAIGISGSGFVSTSIVNWNGAPRATTFVSPTQLTATLLAADVAAAGTAAVTVTTPGPGGGTSAAVPFAVVATCAVDVVPVTQAFSARGGASSAQIQAPAGCPWNATADQPWITLTSTPSGSGTASVGYSVAPNPGSRPRTGHLVVGSSQLSIDQAGAACAVSIAAAPASFAAVGGTGVASVTASPLDCSWTVLSSVPWLSLVGPASGTGDGAVGFEVAPNPGALARNGSLSAGGQAVAVDQAGRPVTLTVTLAGSGSGRVVSVPAGIDCGVTCVAGFPAGQQLTLATTAAPGSVFDQWGGDPDCTDGAVTLDADLRCTATFRADTLGSPVPFIDAVVPAAVVPGAPGVHVTVIGANFSPASTVRWSGVDYVPVVATSTRLEALIPASEVASTRTATVAVWTPAPGGGVSNPALVPVAVATASPQFLGASVASGAGPVAVVTGDVNADGRLDLISANLVASSVSVALGNGDGTFGAPTDFATGASPDDVLLADLNRDGRPDVVTTNATANSVSVLLGNGDGTFTAGAEVAVTAAPVAVAAADLNADGALDLVVAGGGSNAASVLLGRGDGTFRAAPDLALAGSARGLVVADFDGDSRLDVAMTEASGVLAVFPGRGDGSFGARAASGVGAGARGVARGDVNGDGIADLVVANELDSTVSVLLGLGGGFGPRVDLSVGANPGDVVVADVNADGRLDVVVTNAGAGSVSLLLGNGDGSFAPRRDFAAGVAAVALDAGDFDGDGRLDLAVANQSTSRIALLAGRLPAGVAISPATVNFGQRAIGAPTTPHDISITNTGASPLVVSGVSLVSGAVGQFEITAETCSGGTVAPSTTCLVRVRFLASASGASTASLQVASNAPGSPHVVVLTGEAVPGASISGFTPTSGGPGTSVTITGTSLGGATAVEFNGLAAQFTVTSPTTIVGIVPVGATSGPIAVTTPPNVATSAASFRVAPRINSLMPGVGGPGVAVTVGGANFAGASSVRFNGVTASFVVDSAGQITAIVPATATTGAVTVTTPAGTAASAVPFLVAPRVSGFAPASGPAGTVVAIDGANFTDATTVTFNGQAAAFTVVSPTRVSATVPASATSGPIAVTTAAGTGVSTGVFTVGPQPPTQFYVSAISGTSVTLRWTAPTLGPAPTGYLLEAGLTPGQALVTLPTGSTLPIFSFAAPTGSFVLRLRTVSGVQVSAVSNEVPLYVNVPVAPSAPTGLTGDVTGNGLTLVWRNTFGGGAPTGVTLDVSGAVTASVPIGLVERFAVSGLPAGNYTFRLRGTNAGGASPPSNAVAVTVPSACAAPPERPDNVLAFRSGTSFVLLWDPPTSGRAPLSYLVTVTGSANASFLFAGRVLAAPLPTGTYGFSVQSVNACGVSPPSPVQTVVMP